MSLQNNVLQEHVGMDSTEEVRILDNIFMVVVAQLVEHLIVVQEVAGSYPVFHPTWTI